MLHATGVDCVGCHPESVTQSPGRQAGSQTTSHQREINEWWDLEETLMTHSTDTMLENRWKIYRGEVTDLYHRVKRAGENDQL